VASEWVEALDGAEADEVTRVLEELAESEEGKELLESSVELGADEVVGVGVGDGVGVSVGSCFSCVVVGAAATVSRVVIAGEPAVT
jgi:hypothetical protein